jgi:hypothetical protein
MPISTMKLPVTLDARADGCALTGTDANGKRVHFEDLLAKGDRVATAAMVDSEGEPTGDVFGPYGHVVSWRDGELTIVEPRAVCDRTGHDVDEGVCPRCGFLVGSVDLTQLPHADYGAAARELAEIHAWLRREHGLEQSEGDGEWGRVSSECDGADGEWEEVGSTLDAVQQAERIAHMEGWCRHHGEHAGTEERLAAIRALLTDEVMVLSDPAGTIEHIKERLGGDFDMTSWVRDVLAATEAVGTRTVAPNVMAQQQTQQAVEVMHQAHRVGQPEVHPGDPTWDVCCTVQLVDGRYEVINTQGDRLHTIVIEPSGALRIEP